MLGHGGQVTLKQATKEGGWEKSKLRIGLGCESITDHFESNNMYKKEVLGYKSFMENLVLYVAKGQLQKIIGCGAWSCINVLVWCFQIENTFLNIVLRKVAKSMENYVLPTLDGCITNCIIPWMSKFGFHTFTLIINFITKIGCLIM